MKVIYRGISYETEIPTIEVVEVVELQQTGFFLGNRFTIKQYNVRQGHPTSVQLKYRGVDYNL